MNVYEKNIYLNMTYANINKHAIFTSDNIKVNLQIDSLILGQNSEQNIIKKYSHRKILLVTSN